ncbi:MAG: putative dehydrogenase/nucleoside-diphosphate-sugar epimerase [Planctomycetota bacterium]|jgi:predicted dehydrogenase/nucleoside-diphosphate-sugar epimerase
MSAVSPSSSPTRVAIVGTGFIADFHLEILRDTPDVEVVALCDPVRHRAESAAKRFNVPKVVTSIDQLVGLGIQVCHLTVPPDLHARLVRECLEADMGVFCEKPLVLTSTESKELDELARSKGLALAANHNAVFHPAFAELKERVEAGEIGKLEHVRVTLSVPLRQLDAGDYSHWMFREPRNIVFEQAVHPFSQIHSLIGKVESLNTTLLSSRELYPGQIFHERWQLAAIGEHGTAELHLAFGRSFTRNTLEVLGSDGCLEADLFHDHLAGEAKTQWLDFWNSFLAGWRRGKQLRRSARTVLTNYFRLTLGMGRREDSFFAGMRGSIQAFHKALREGATLPADGRAATEVIEWCEAAAANIQGSKMEAFVAPEPGEPRDGEVVVIGGTGFIGKRTIAALLAQGRNVTCVVRRFHSLPPVVVEGAKSGHIRLVRGDLDDAASITNAVRGASVVLQLATGGGARWEDFERQMIGGSSAVADACIAEDARLIFVSSTAALYLGHDCGTDLIEDTVKPDPQPAKRPLYARGKIAAEHALEELAKTKGLKLVIARPGVVLGPDTPLQHSGLGLWVRDNHCVGWGVGEHPLPLVLADDVADALTSMVVHEGDDIHGRNFNLCVRAPLSAREMVAEMRAYTKRDLHFHARPMGRSQIMEIGKWIVKKVGGRKDAEFPSWRDLKSRALVPQFSARAAREFLGWNPVEEREAFLDGALGRNSDSDSGSSANSANESSDAQPSAAATVRTETAKS